MNVELIGASFGPKQMFGQKCSELMYAHFCAICGARLAADLNKVAVAAVAAMTAQNASQRARRWRFNREVNLGSEEREHSKT